MADIATLGLAMESEGLKEGVATLKQVPQAASAAERATEKYSATTMKAANSNEEFSKRSIAVVRSLEFERQQLSRTAAEQAKYAAVRRAGVSVDSAAGTAIAAAVAALQAQKAASEGAAKGITVVGSASKAASAAATGLVTQLRGLAAAYAGVQTAQNLWQTAMKAGDLGEQAEQVGVNTDQLQAYQLAGAQAGIAAEEFNVSLVKLAKTMGNANEGNKEAIELFNSLGVKILDAAGKMRPVADVLPEVATGLLKIESTSEKTAKQMEVFGKGGAKMTTALGELTKGNDALIESAKKENAIISAATIAQWDTVGDKMKVVNQQWKTLVAEFGAPLVATALTDLNKFIATTKEEIEALGRAWVWVKNLFGDATGSSLKGMQSEAGKVTANIERLQSQPPTSMNQAMLNRELARLGVLQKSIDANTPVMPTTTVTATPLPPGGTSGARSPVAKASGGCGKSDPYKSAIESAREYVLAKNAETAAVGLSAEAAARMTHEQALLNKVQTDGKVATDAQKAAIADWAVKMAEADAKLKTANFMENMKKSAEDFIASQEIERETLFMSAEAAMAYRLEQEALNRAKSEGITLTDQQKSALGALASAQAASAERTRQTKEMVDLAKDSINGFVTDMVSGLREGKDVWETFGNAAMNALNKIADKLISMAVDDLVGSAFGKSGGSSGGGFLSSIIGALGGGGMGAAGTAGSPYYGPIAPAGFASGGAFYGGNVIPFARGGVVNRPTIFPMANGMGLMGEAGPEAVMPLRRGRGGKLGVEASGGGGVVVNINNYADGTKATARESKGPGGQMQIDVIVEAVEGKMAGRMSRGQGSLGKTMEGTYGLQRVGR